jgi:hypothetical protein
MRRERVKISVEFNSKTYFLYKDIAEMSEREIREAVMFVLKNTTEDIEKIITDFVATTK